MATERQRLRARRRRLGYTQESIAHAMSVAVSTYRSWETGAHSPHHWQRQSLARALDVSLDELDVLLDGDRHTAAPDGQVVPEWLSLFASLEQGASHLWAWEPVTVHGLLQIPEYAEAVEAAAVDATLETAHERARARLARQAVLTREPEPVHLAVVLDESTLRRTTGSAEVMADQLDHLADVSGRANVEIRILPLAAGVHAAGWGWFTVLGKSESQPHLVCDSDATGIRYQESPYVIERHLRLFHHLARLALTPASSADLIRMTAKEYRQ